MVEGARSGRASKAGFRLARDTLTADPNWYAFKFTGGTLYDENSPDVRSGLNENNRVLASTGHHFLGFRLAKAVWEDDT
jgi:hypothetical protein